MSIASEPENIPDRLADLLSTILIEIVSLQRSHGYREDGDQAGGSSHSFEQDPFFTQRLQQIERWIREALYLARSSSAARNALFTEQLILSDALAHRIEEAAEEIGASSRISITGTNDDEQQKQNALSLTARHLLLLATQELLEEIKQHQQVHRLRFSFAYGEKGVQLAITDDGNLPSLIDSDAKENTASALPFLQNEESQSSQSSSSTILDDLKQRIEQIGGRFTFEPNQPQGMHFQITIPYISEAGQVEEAGELAVPEPFTTLTTPTPSQPLQVSSVIPILIVDHQAVTRAGLRHLLEIAPDIRVIGEASDGIQAVSETLELGPRVVLMETQLPGTQTLDALRQIKQLNSDTRVLLLAPQEHEEYLYETLRAGADGYLLKDIAPEELAQAIRTVARGEILIQPQIASRIITRYGRQGRTTRDDSLTTRELEVLSLLRRGLRNKEIAARLSLSERTVNFHLANIYQKLNVSGRTEALSKALEQGLLTTL